MSNLSRHRLAAVCVAVLVLLTAYAVLVPLLAPAQTADFAVALRPPSLAHPFGAEHSGYDLFVRVAEGLRVSLLIAAVCALLPTGGTDHGPLRPRRRRAHQRHIHGAPGPDHGSRRAVGPRKEHPGQGTRGAAGARSWRGDNRRRARAHPARPYGRADRAAGAGPPPGRQPADDAAADHRRAGAGWIGDGTAERAYLARALHQGPSYLLADEPTAMLDTATATIAHVLRGLADSGVGVLAISHDRALLDAMCDSVLAWRPAAKLPSMADLVTLTLNPALDVTVVTPQVVPARKLRCGQPLFEAGGGGINIAKVAHVLGVEAAAVYPFGGDSGLQMSALLEEHAVREHPIRIAGTTRESFTALEAGGDNEYRFVLPGPELTTAELGQCLEALAKAAVGSRVVALSGSLPPGVPTSVVAEVAAIARDAGARLVLDSSGDALREAAGDIFLVKPSVGELRGWVGRKLDGDDEIADAARTIIADGIVQIAVVSLGPDGAMLVSADEVVRAPAIDAPVRSTVGAGDSMVAGLITGFLQERSLADTLSLGIACATAALLTPGSEVCRRADIDRFYAELAGA